MGFYQSSMNTIHTYWSKQNICRPSCLDSDHISRSETTLSYWVVLLPLLHHIVEYAINKTSPIGFCSIIKNWVLAFKEMKYAVNLSNGRKVKICVLPTFVWSKKFWNQCNEMMKLVMHGNVIFFSRFSEENLKAFYS